MNGEPVRVWFTMPLMFKLKGDPKPANTTDEKADNPTIYMRTHKPEPGKNPLFLLDGVPVEASALANMNQENIDSIHVRKDAAFTAQYGEAGKHGVVVITSKKAAAKTESSQAVDDVEKVYENADDLPKFNGGDMDMYRWLSRNIRYPEEAAKKNIQGRVTLQFVVEKDGSIGPVKIISGVDPLLDAEAIRVVKSMPNFIPGKKDGEPVRVWYSMPLMFKLAGDDKK